MHKSLTKSELEHGAYYAGHCRNAQIARWDAERNRFIHWRTKFFETFLEEIKHPDDEKNFDVFLASHKIDTPEKPIPLSSERE